MTRLRFNAETLCGPSYDPPLFKLASPFWDIVASSYYP